VTKEGALDRVNPFRDRNVADQLSAWSAAVEMAVATLNQTLTELKGYQQEGESDVGDVEDGAGGAAGVGGAAGGG
jgi:hypothetical protein